MRRANLVFSTASALALLAAAGGQTEAQSQLTWNGTAGATWSTGTTNWLGGSVASPWDSTSGPSNAAVVTATGSASVSGTVFANRLTFTSGTGTFSVGGGTLAFAGATPTVATTSTNQVISLFSSLSGSGGLLVVGSGTTILSGNNTALTGTYSIGTGTFADGSGVIVLSNADAVAGATSVSLVATGAGNGNRGQMLQLGNGTTITGKSLVVTQSGTNRAALLVASGGTAAWNGDITISPSAGQRAYLWADGMLTIGTGTNTVVTSTTSDQFALRGTGTGTINSAIGSRFFKSDTGTWFITSTNNSFSGQINIASGVLSIASIANVGANSSIGSDGTIVLQGASGLATLQFTGSQGGSTNRRFQLVGDVTGGSGGTIENAVAGQTLTLTGTVTTLDANPAILRLGGVGNGVSAGNIAGTGAVSVTKLGSGTWTISGSNAYTGSTTISAGQLQVGSAGQINNTTGITINGTGAEFRFNSSTPLTKPITFTRGILSGTGTINTPVSIGSNAILSPGNSPGIQTYQSGTFAGGGGYTWEINNWASGTAGVNFDQAIFTNGLAITSSSASRFTINLTSLKADNTSGAVEGFNNGLTGLSFVIATGSMAGYSPSVFTLGTSGFLAANTVSGSANGGFWLSTNSGSSQLSLNYAPSARYTLSATPAATAIYAGGTTTITGSITNSTADRTGSDTMQFLNLSVGTGSLTVTSGTLAAGGGTAGTFNFTSGSTGSFTFNPTVSATNVNLGTAALAGTVTSGTVTVWNQAAVNQISTVALGNVRVGGTFGTAALTITNTAAGGSFTEVLGATGSTLGLTSLSGSVSGLAGGGTSTAMSVGLGGSANTGSAGVKSGTASISFTSTGGPGTASIAAQNVLVSGTVWNTAVGSITSSTSVNLGLIHAGQSFSSSTLTIANTAAAGGFSEGLNASVSGSTGNATFGGTTITNLTAGGTASTITVGLGDTSTGGVKNGTITIGYQSNGSTTSGLSTISAGSQVVSLNGSVFSGTATWNIAGGGAWGTGASSSWTSTGGVAAAPGTFAGYTTTDAAILAGGQSGTSTILLDGATPSLASLVFSNTTGRYVLDQGSGGSLTLATASGKPTIDVVAGGLHEIKTAILGSNGLNKIGGGTLIISGSNGFTGGTDLSAGTLAVNGFLSGAVDVASGATLAGAGQVGGLVTVAAGGILAPGNSPGTLTMEAGLSLADASILNFELSGTNFTAGGGINDLIAVTGDLTLDGILNIAAIGGGDFTGVGNGSTWTLFTYTGSLTNNGISFNSMPSLGEGRSYAIDTSTSGMVNLVIVPEPGAVALALVGIASGAAWSMRSRRRQEDTAV